MRSLFAAAGIICLSTTYCFGASPQPAFTPTLATAFALVGLLFFIVSLIQYFIHPAAENEAVVASWRWKAVLFCLAAFVVTASLVLVGFSSLLGLPLWIAGFGVRIGALGVIRNPETLLPRDEQ